MIDDRTAHKALPLVHPDNDLSEDVLRLRSAQVTVDALIKALEDRLAALGTAANANVATANNDVTLGRLMPVGYGGLGALAPPALANVDTVNTPHGPYTVASPGGTLPAGVNPNGVLEVVRFSATNLFQVFTPIGQTNQGILARQWVRTYHAVNAAWNLWFEYLTSATAGTAAWANLTTTALDGVAGRVLKVGDGGLLGNAPTFLGNIDTIGSVPKCSVYCDSGTGTTGTLPTPFGLMNTVGVGTTVNQDWFEITSTGSATKRRWYRSVFNGSVGPWVELFHTGNFNPATKADLVAFTAFQEVVNTQLASRTRAIIALPTTTKGTTDTVSVNVGAAELFTLEVTISGTGGTTTISFDNIPETAGRIVSWQLEIRSGGAKTLAWPSTVRWTGGLPTLQSNANSREVLNFYKLAGRSVIYGMVVDAGVFT
ncbi:MAG: hypothetical protein ABWY06_20020 [Pseudomonas sp.]|uniref:hypothetical protein n=1 Tax=Pseudomonas sp. TaxID=306 RepID=UPI00339B0649